MDIFSDEYFMKKALNEAHTAYENGEVPVGAIIVSKNQIISRSYNLVERLKDVTAHAEILVITSALNNQGGKYLSDCTIYVTLEPCDMCAGALAWSQIDKIVYGAKDEKRGFTQYIPNIISHKTTVKFGVLESECSKILKQFFNKKRN